MEKFEPFNDLIRKSHHQEVKVQSDGKELRKWEQENLSILTRLLLSFVTITFIVVILSALITQNQTTKKNIKSKFISLQNKITKKTIIFQIF
jgi:hypothetical protein